MARTIKSRDVRVRIYVNNALEDPPGDEVRMYGAACQLLEGRATSFQCEVYDLNGCK